MGTKPALPCRRRPVPNRAPERPCFGAFVLPPVGPVRSARFSALFPHLLRTPPSSALLRLLPALFLLLSLLTISGTGPASAEPLFQQATVHPLVAQTIQAQGQAEVLVILRAQADLSAANALPTREARAAHAYQALRSVARTSQQALRAMLDARDLDYQSFYIVNAIRVRANSDLLQSLAARPEVDRIVPNPRVKGVPDLPPGPAAAPGGIEPNLVRVNADDVWALGYTGQGVVVAGQDTGYDWDHPALVNQYRGWDGAAADHDYNWHDAVHSGGGLCGSDSTQPCDDHGHGTHTMGTIIGDDGADASDDASIGRNQIGMAPGAQWIGCRNMDQGVGTPATYIECFEFFLAPYPVGGTPAQGNPSLAPDVVNNSWSCPPSEGCDAGTLEAAVSALRQAGIAVVVSAGNSGSACGSVDRPPAIYQGAISTGAFSHSTNQIASFSSRGPVSYAGKTYVKPDIAAPGVSIRSSTRGGGYGYNSGTSMAAPHVTGAVALLLSAASDLRGQVEAIEQTLTASAEPRLDGQCGDPEPPNNVWGWGILDALAAVESATTGTLQGIVTRTSTGEPIAGAQVTASPSSLPGPGSEATSGTTGGYSMALPAGVYSVTVRADGYQEQRAEGVVVRPREATNQNFALAAGRYSIIILFGIPAGP